MRTSEEIYHRVRWDPRFDPARFVLGVYQRSAEPKRIPLGSFTPGGDIPWHRVLFVEADGEVVWDRAAGLDLLDTVRAGRVRALRRLRAPFFTADTPYGWDPVAARWSPADGAPANGPQPHGAPTGGALTTPSPLPVAAGVRVVTWNTLWDRYDSDRIDTARRRPLLLARLAEADADVIALQEVEPALVDLLLRAPWVRAGYTLGSDPTARALDDHGLLLLSRLPVLEAGRHRLGPHKAVTAVTVQSAAGPLVVAATHLSSDHSERGADRRQAELARLREGLAGIEGQVVLLGDFNDGRDTPDGPAAVLALRDAWSEVHGPADRTPTFDPGVNPLAAVSSLSGRASRLDRVLLRTEALRATGARLCGELPTPDGLFPSDHYGVAVDLSCAPADRGELLDSAPTARTAVAWLPAPELRPVIEEIRRAHDPQVRRWPPHVNLLFGFVPESDFAQAAALIGAASAELPSFTTRLAGVHTFGHREDATVWLDPAAADPAPWAALRHALERRFPGCRGRAEGYTPHLTLGRSTDPQRVAAESAARLGPVLAHQPAHVGELTLLSRRGDEPVQPRAVVTLGTGELRWLPEPAVVADTAAGTAASATACAEELTARIAGALPESVVHLVGSRRMGCAPAGADLDLVAVLPGDVELADVQARVAAAVQAADRLRPVPGARVPGLRLHVGALTVDLVVVGSGSLPPTEAVTRRAELGTAAGLALSAVTDAASVLATVAGDQPGAHDERTAAFALLARRVKSWAKARGLDSAPFGGLPGVAWSVLAARTVHEAGALPADDLLRHFFATWAAWDWRRPVTLHATQAEAPEQAPVTILTPSEPVRSCTEQVGAGGRDLLVRELYRAWEVLESAAQSGAGVGSALLAPPPLHRRHTAWAVLTVRQERPEAFERTLGLVRGRVRSLLTDLQQAGATDAHAWPRPFDTAPGLTHYAIGLGRTAPDRARLTEIATRWTAGLHGVELHWAENGAVPTLR
ncbi:hypothetical protein GCM10009665_29280 [Kitasatospora nipponensis]|uniref:Polynucleotide adenylyltransferase n=1 Tax=Kitasatospora nipponensis TaxID=258049 RepID=A0ABN1WBP0_9ACTN